MPPYRTLADLPAAQVDQYDHHQRRAFLEAFNHALKTYHGDEHRAFAVAHTAAKRAGEKEAREHGAPDAHGHDAHGRRHDGAAG